MAGAQPIPRHSFAHLVWNYCLRKGSQPWLPQPEETFHVRL
jgi:hypothetical protein